MKAIKTSNYSILSVSIRSRCFPGFHWWVCLRNADCEAQRSLAFAFGLSWVCSKPYVFCKIISWFLSPCFRYVFFLDPCNLDLINRKIKSIALCVAACPRQELKTLSDVQKFAEINGEMLGCPSQHSGVCLSVKCYVCISVSICPYSKYVIKQSSRRKKAEVI